MTFATYPSLAGRIALITGGASGIGAEMVRQFAQNAAKVAFIDIQDEAAQALVAELVGQSVPAPLFLHCDVTDIPALRAAIDEVRAALGPITVLVNNAGNDQRHQSHEVSPESWGRTLALNLDHQFFACQAVRRQMQAAGGGAIVNLSSIAWMGGGANLVAYSAAKAAIIGMTNSLAHEFGEDGIRVNAIAPGAVITPRQLELWYSEADVDAIVARQCLKERLMAADIARLALFLAADDGRMITKQCLVIDAGLR
jgi:NAD(P)-dependent dehydrogenase (short-subunit alcohol dehydrogenase family)